MTEILPGDSETLAPNNRLEELGAEISAVQQSLFELSPEYWQSMDAFTRLPPLSRGQTESRRRAETNARRPLDEALNRLRELHLEYARLVVQDARRDGPPQHISLRSDR